MRYSFNRSLISVYVMLYILILYILYYIILYIHVYIIAYIHYIYYCIYTIGLSSYIDTSYTFLFIFVGFFFNLVRFRVLRYDTEYIGLLFHMYIHVHFIHVFIGLFYGSCSIYVGIFSDVVCFQVYLGVL